MPPLVLITSIPRRIETTLPGRMANATINQRFGWFVAQAGGLPVAADAWCEPSALIERVDALVVNGGTDVDPARYGAARAVGTQESDVRRDDFEFGLVDAARRRGLPILGVCRGMQLLNVALGGDLLQDLSAATDVPHYVNDPYDRPVHDVDLVPGSAIAECYGAERLAVNSVHHQGVGRLGDGLRCAARSPDGITEAIEDPTGRLLGIQWHPEFLVDEHAGPHVALFRALLDRCGVAAEP